MFPANAATLAKLGVMHVEAATRMAPRAEPRAPHTHRHLLRAPPAPQARRAVVPRRAVPTAAQWEAGKFDPNLNTFTNVRDLQFVMYEVYDTLDAEATTWVIRCEDPGFDSPERPRHDAFATQTSEGKLFVVGGDEPA